MMTMIAITVGSDCPMLSSLSPPARQRQYWSNRPITLQSLRNGGHAPISRPVAERRRSPGVRSDHKLIQHRAHVHQKSASSPMPTHAALCPEKSCYSRHPYFEYSHGVSIWTSTIKPYFAKHCLFCRHVQRCSCTLPAIRNSIPMATDCWRQRVRTHAPEPGRRTDIGHCRHVDLRTDDSVNGLVMRVDSRRTRCRCRANTGQG